MARTNLGPLPEFPAVWLLSPSARPWSDAQGQPAFAAAPRTSQQAPSLASHHRAGFRQFDDRRHRHIEFRPLAIGHGRDEAVTGRGVGAQGSERLQGLAGDTVA
jgi:hypothetical protein